MEIRDIRKPFSLVHDFDTTTTLEQRPTLMDASESGLRDFTVTLDDRTITNLRATAKANGLSISALLRIIFSTPARSTELPSEVRNRIRQRIEDARKHG